MPTQRVRFYYLIPITTLRPFLLKSSLQGYFWSANSKREHDSGIIGGARGMVRTRKLFLLPLGTRFRRSEHEGKVTILTDVGKKRFLALEEPEKGLLCGAPPKTLDTLKRFLVLAKDSIRHKESDPCFGGETADLVVPNLSVLSDRQNLQFATSRARTYEFWGCTWSKDCSPLKVKSQHQSRRTVFLKQNSRSRRPELIGALEVPTSQEPPRGSGGRQEKKNEESFAQPSPPGVPGHPPTRTLGQKNNTCRLGPLKRSRLLAKTRNMWSNVLRN